MDNLYKIINNLDTNKKSSNGMNKRILLDIFESRGQEFFFPLFTGVFLQK